MRPARTASASGSLNANTAVTPAARSSSARAPARQPSGLVTGTSSTGTPDHSSPAASTARTEPSRRAFVTLATASAWWRRSAGPGREWEVRPKLRTARRRCPRSSRWRTAVSAAARSSIPTNPGSVAAGPPPIAARSATAGESTITVGSRRRRAAWKSGSSAAIEYTIRPSTAALPTAGPIDGCTSGRPGTSTSASRRGSVTSDTPRRSSTVAGSSKASARLRRKTTPIAPARPLRRLRATGSGPP